MSSSCEPVVSIFRLASSCRSSESSIAWIDVGVKGPPSKKAWTSRSTVILSLGVLSFCEEEEEWNRLWWWWFFVENVTVFPVKNGEGLGLQCRLILERDCCGKSLWFCCIRTNAEPRIVILWIRIVIIETATILILLVNDEEERSRNETRKNRVLVVLLVRSDTDREEQPMDEAIRCELFQVVSCYTGQEKISNDTRNLKKSNKNRISWWMVDRWLSFVVW